MISLIFKGIWISLLGYASSYFFQFLIDDIQKTTPFFYMIVLCLAYGVIEMMKTYQEKVKTKQTLSFQKAIDEDYVFTSSMNMLKLPQTFFYQDKGYIQSQLLSLFDLTQMSIECFERLFIDGISFIIFMIGMLIINYQMALVVLVMLICISAYTYHRLKSLEEVNKRYLEASFIYQHHILELIENQFLIKRFLLHQRTRERSYDLYLDMALQKEKHGLVLNQLQSTVSFFIYFFYTIILIMGFWMFQQHFITMGQLLMFYMLVSYCIEPIIHIVTLMSQYKQMSVIYEKYKAFEYVEEKEKIKLDEKIQTITFDNVSYAYGYQMPLFEHIDLKIERHMLVRGIIGSGKSTLLKLLMGFDLNYTGDIYINQHELRMLDLSSLYRHIGYTTETPTFLHLPLYDNFLCQDEKKIIRYLKDFGQEGLIEMFHLVLDEDGSPLSLGQRQIVALIRLLCQDYDVLILDEAFSHMDTRLANKVMRYLLKNDEGKIYIVVSHQTKIVNKNMDYVIIEKGKLKNER